MPKPRLNKSQKAKLAELKAQQRANAEAAQARADRINSCEVEASDCFLSMWANDAMSSKLRLEIELLEVWGGKPEFPGLFDLDGNRVAAKLIDGRYGQCWAICDEDGKFTGEFVNHVSPNPEYSTPRRHANLAKKGYKVAYERVEAGVGMAGGDKKGMPCGPAHYYFYRKDQCYPEEAKVK